MPSPSDPATDISLGRHLEWVRQRLARLAPDYRFKWDVYFDRLDELAAGVSRFLDAGCGANQTAHELTGPRLRLGVDLTPDARRGTYVCARLEALPFRTGAFDLIGCRHVSEHLEDPAGVIDEWRRVLAPGGRILIQTVNKQSLMLRLARLIRGRLRHRILASRYGRRPEDHFKTFDRFNIPILYQHPPDGFRLVGLTMVQDVDLQSKFGFWLTYLLVILTRRRPERRSVITVEWQRLPRV